MIVLDDAPVRELPAGRACGHDRNLTLVIDQRLVNHLRRIGRPFPRLGRIDPRLPLAVVTEAGGLEDGGRAQFAHGGVKIRLRAHRAR